MEKILNDSAWTELSENFAWTEQMLEKHKNKVDWKAISNNNNIVWTPAMLDKIPSSQLQDSRLWRELVEERAKELKLEVIA